MSRPSTSSYTAPTTNMLSIPLLSTPPTHQIASQSHQHLLLASISTLYASALAARRRKERREREMVEGGLLPSDVLKSHLRGEGQAGGGGTALGEEEERELREEVRRRLDEMGERVGGDLAERLAFSRPRFVDPLDIVKFICKDVWQAAFEKQVDNLRTNHRGIFVLQDSIFPPISHISTHLGHAADLRAAQIHLAFPQGLLRGALARLGLPSTVSVETNELPQVTFQLKTTILKLGA